VFPPGPDADQGRSPRIREDLLGLLDVDDDLWTERHLHAEGWDRGRFPRHRFEAVSRLDPPVVATVEEPDVVDPGVAEDHQGTGRGDLTCPPTRPLLVRIPLGVATVDHDRRVMGDPERTEGALDGFG
jgi:hypothetical protein